MDTNTVPDYGEKEDLWGGSWREGGHAVLLPAKSLSLAWCLQFIAVRCDVRGRRERKRMPLTGSSEALVVRGGLQRVWLALVARDESADTTKHHALIEW